jgi:hypothetical protein
MGSNCHISLTIFTIDFVVPSLHRCTPDQLPVFSQPLTVRAAKDHHTFLMKFARQHQGIALNHSTGNDSMPEPTKMQQLLEAVLEVTNVKQSKAEVGGLKGNCSYAKKKRDKVDGEAVRSENVMGFAMCVDQNTSSGVKSVPKKVKKASPLDSVLDLQDMVEKNTPNYSSFCCLTCC